ncbi:hypothetical protein UPYG_G00291970 [Umbra pygmaea]|uniref:G-protein coupled receptors family 1 profile domain-containing protein n=1 Tax=Umbra pygmaea TaxID=75934 RepID=A0ABD0W5F0_UMBPY
MLFGLCSLTSLTLLSMVCFLKVCYPLYGNRFSTVHGLWLIAFAWAYALVFACSPLAHWGEYGPEPYGTACCIDWRLSNVHPGSRSYTAAIFVFCYILPCCVIVASYTGILMRVRASHKAMEHHLSRPIKMSNIQAVIVKLSIAVCFGFLAAWSPYAVVSMWAAFGNMENIPPLAFALPAMFAKSSTIYNPVIYLMLRPNFRRVVCRDLLSLWRTCLKGCLSCCSQDDVVNGHTCSATRLSLQSVCRTPPRNLGCSITLPHHQALERGGCNSTCDVFDWFSHYPRGCGGDAHAKTPQDQPSAAPELQLRTVSEERTRKQRRQQKKEMAFHKNPLRATIHCKRTSEIETLQRNLQMIPGHAKVAWP